MSHGLDEITIYGTPITVAVFSLIIAFCFFDFASRAHYIEANNKKAYNVSSFQGDLWFTWGGKVERQNTPNKTYDARHFKYISHPKYEFSTDGTQLTISGFYRTTTELKFKYRLYCQDRDVTQECIGKPLLN